MIDRMRLPFRKDKESYSNLYNLLGFYPRHIQYYKQALLHKSSSKGGGKSAHLNNNERLEFLGDAILSAIVGDIVYQHFEGKREGFLTNTRSKIVQRETLNKISEEIGLDKYIQADLHNSSHNSYMGGNAFEALIGAIYLDRGYDYCMMFMKRRILNGLINIDKVAYKEVNFKSKLIEWSQKNKVDTSFELIEESKEESSGSPVFLTKVSIEGLESGTGKGYSKKESQQNAAKMALKKLKRNPKFIEEIFNVKSQRTAMEEEPTSIPSIEINFLESETNAHTAPARDVKEETTDGHQKDCPLFDVDFQEKEQSKEEIIAAAENAAFGQLD